MGKRCFTAWRVARVASARQMRRIFCQQISRRMRRPASWDNLPFIQPEGDDEWVDNVPWEEVPEEAAL